MTKRQLVFAAIRLAIMAVICALAVFAFITINSANPTQPEEHQAEVVAQVVSFKKDLSSIDITEKTSFSATKEKTIEQIGQRVETETQSDVQTEQVTKQDENETKVSTEVETEPQKIYKAPDKYIGMVMDLPTDIPRTFKSMAKWRALRASNSVQQIAYTDENGFRRVDEYYAVAMASYYTNRLGDLFHITTDGGEFDVIITDTKSDRHTDANHMYSISCKCMCEFYVEWDDVDPYIRRLGSCEKAKPEFNGAITSVTYLGNYFDGDR